MKLTTFLLVLAISCSVPHYTEAKWSFKKGWNDFKKGAEDLGNKVGDSIEEGVNEVGDFAEDVFGDTKEHLEESKIIDGAEEAVNAIDKNVIKPTGECTKDIKQCAKEIEKALPSVEKVFEKAAQDALGKAGDALETLVKVFNDIKKNHWKYFQALKKAVINTDEKAIEAAFQDLLTQVAESNFSPFKTAVEEFKKYDASSILFIFSVGGGVGIQGSIDYALAVDVDYILFPFQLIANKAAKKDTRTPAKSGKPAMTLFSAVGISSGLTIGASADFAVGYHIMDPPGVGGPGIDVNMEIAGKVGVGASLSFDAKPLVQKFETPKLLAAIGALKIGAELDLSIAGGYAEVLAQFCPDKSFLTDNELALGIIFPPLMIDNGGVDKKCPDVTTRYIQTSR